MQTSRPRTDRAEEPRPARDRSGPRWESPGTGATVPPPLTADVLRAAQGSAGNAAVSGMIARRASAAQAPAQQDTGVREVLGSAGRPLTGPVRSEMESRFGTDFSGVRLHTGAAAARSARAIGARAYTSGSHVVLGEGGRDKHTLAHELTHVVQQRQGPVSGTDRGTGCGSATPATASSGRRRATPGGCSPGRCRWPAPSRTTAPGTTRATGTTTPITGRARRSARPTRTPCSVWSASRWS
ncbi:DUF4157 domain-containing protein [Streptomyces venezuelae ATCC 10712]